MFTGSSSFPQALGDQPVSGAVSQRHPHSHGVPKWLFVRQLIGDIALPRSTVVAGIVIADLVNAKTGYAWPSQEYLANRLGVSTTRAVQKMVSQLVRRGHIRVASGRGRGRSSRYWLVLKEAKKDTPIGHLSKDELMDKGNSENGNRRFAISDELRREPALQKSRTETSAISEPVVRTSHNKENHQVSGARVRALEEPLDRLADLMGIERSRLHPGLRAFPVRFAEWQSDGCDPERDIWPTITAVLARSGRAPYSPAYFSSAILRARDERRASEPSETERWFYRVETFYKTGYWFDGWGPKPSERGCLAPAQLLKETTASDQTVSP